MQVAIRQEIRALWVLKALCALAGLGAGLWMGAFRDCSSWFGPGAPPMTPEMRSLVGDNAPSSFFDVRVLAVAVGTVVAYPTRTLLATVALLLGALATRPRR